jgi:hypothetical protein
MSAASVKKDAFQVSQALRNISNMAKKPNLVKNSNVFFKNADGTTGKIRSNSLPGKSYNVDQNKIYSGKTAADKIKKNPLLAKRYLNQMQDITKLNLDPKQVRLLKVALRDQKFELLSSEAQVAHRNQFKSLLPKIRKEWELNTGQKWPTYQVIERNKQGIEQLVPKNYEAHHIIQVSHGGPNKWWNIHPALRKEHMDIHWGEGSTAKQIFTNFKDKK